MTYHKGHKPIPKEKPLFVECERTFQTIYTKSKTCWQRRSREPSDWQKLIGSEIQEEERFQSNRQKNQLHAKTPHIPRKDGGTKMPWSPGQWLSNPIVESSPRWYSTEYKVSRPMPISSLQMILTHSSNLCVVILLHSKGEHGTGQNRNIPDTISPSSEDYRVLWSRNKSTFTHGLFDQVQKGWLKVLESTSYSRYMYQVQHLVPLTSI